MEMSVLPEEFLKRMKALLGEEFEAFLASCGEEEVHSLRLNTLKNGEDVRGFFSLTPVSWADDAYYYKSDERPGKNPLHEAGAYYIQEASAMLPVTQMDIRGELKVLDLCAAPGGKSTQLAAAMKGRGILVSNEVIPKRAKILSENIERLGVTNAVVLNEAPERLAGFFGGYFDRILVDAPCSGEGMFRKNPGAAGEWSTENVLMCAERQINILECAALMLSDGGRLVYSTCTFSPEEDEEVIRSFLTKNPEYDLVETAAEGGVEYGRLENTLRIFPHKAKGEGHFTAVLKKRGRNNTYEARQRGREKNKIPEGVRREFEAFVRDNLCCKPEFSSCRMFGDVLCAVPSDLFSIQGLKVERLGLELGRVKSGLFIPAHAWAMAIDKRICRSYEVKDEDEAYAYLRGEALKADAARGWLTVTYKGYTMGWGKSDGKSIKNHYPKGLRKA